MCELLIYALNILNPLHESVTGFSLPRRKLCEVFGNSNDAIVLCFFGYNIANRQLITCNPYSQISLVSGDCRYCLFKNNRSRLVF